MNLSSQAASYGSWNVSGLVSTAIPNMGHLYSHFTHVASKWLAVVSALPWAWPWWGECRRRGQ